MTLDSHPGSSSSTGSSAGNHRPAPRIIGLRIAIVIIAAAAILAGGVYGYAIAVTPAGVRRPVADHSHLRLEVVYDGTAVNFGENKFQTSYDQATCSAKLPMLPIHFHDGADQFLHLHWAGVTGGMVLKDFGWNLIGGPADTLGYRFDSLPRLGKVSIHGHDLPRRAGGTSYYVYTGTATSFSARSWNDFLHQDLTTFLSGSKVTSAHNFWTSRLVWSALAGSSAVAASDTDMTAAMPGMPASGDEERTRVNHVLGNVVIFAQKTPPTFAQVRDRFEKLLPLPDSVCGG